MLAADIDTLASPAISSVVGVFDRAGTVEARAWVRGSSQASFEDGANLGVDDVSQGVTFTFTPGAAAHAIVVITDLRSRTGNPAPITHVSVSGTDLPQLATETEVRAAAGNAYALTNDTLILRLEGPTSALAN